MITRTYVFYMAIVLVGLDDSRWRALLCKLGQTEIDVP